MEAAQVAAAGAWGSIQDEVQKLVKILLLHFDLLEISKSMLGGNLCVARCFDFDLMQCGWLIMITAKWPVLLAGNQNER